MTHSGGKPHAVGDIGQRYEVSFYDPALGERRVFGWTDSLDTARDFMYAIEVHPTWKLPELLDRRPYLDS